MSCERRPIGEHLRRFNDPITNEVAVLMVGTGAIIQIQSYIVKKEFNELMN